MLDSTTTTGTFYEGWRNYQEALLKALEPLTGEQLALSAGNELRTIGMIATHMVGARGRWLHELLGEGGPELGAMARWDRPVMQTFSAQELVAALRSTWGVLADCVERWTAEDMAQVFTATRGGQTLSFTRQSVIWHLIEHDLHHGGEISLSLGMHGLTAPDI